MYACWYNITCICNFMHIGFIRALHSYYNCIAYLFIITIMSLLTIFTTLNVFTRGVSMATCVQMHL